MSNPSSVLTRRKVLRWLSLATCTGLAGCASFSDSQTENRQNARIVIALNNPGDVEQDYEVEVTWGYNNRSQFSGTLQPAESNTEMLATTAGAPESATFFIGTANSSRSGEWNPIDCPDYRVDAVIEDGTQSFDTACEE